ncbi:TetR/AcrR family transcriptional regulator [Paracoccus denitrificans]|uniref:TetR/AcrR family transcriptional regulator n=1 Tax=Paracoccus denitrificans TaxID=266 RepID=UPI003364D308
MPPQVSQWSKPRKTPVQRRSRVTVDAIFEATIQVLLAEGLARLTTTRVSERAGVSVGTMYQYFPNKQALIIALNERYLNTLAERVEGTCSLMAGQPASKMVSALIETYWTTKTERADLTQALYRSVAALDNSELMQAFATRVDAATTKMFRAPRFLTACAVLWPVRRLEEHMTCLGRVWRVGFAGFTGGGQRRLSALGG